MNKNAGFMYSLRIKDSKAIIIKMEQPWPPSL